MSDHEQGPRSSNGDGQRTGAREVRWHALSATARRLTLTAGAAVIALIVLAVGLTSSGGANPTTSSTATSPTPASAARLSDQQTVALNDQGMKLLNLEASSQSNPERATATPVLGIIQIITDTNASLTTTLSPVPGLPADVRTVSQFLDVTYNSLQQIGAQGQALRVLRFEGKLADGFAPGA